MITAKKSYALIQMGEERKTDKISASWSLGCGSCYASFKVMSRANK